MQETTARPETFDLSHIQDPDVRRALRVMNQQVTEALNRHQMEIEALVEVLLERHLTSIGEFKRASNELRHTLDEEIRVEEQKEQRSKIESEQNSAIDAATVMTPASPDTHAPDDETVSRTPTGTSA